MFQILPFQYFQSLLQMSLWYGLDFGLQSRCGMDEFDVPGQQHHAGDVQLVPPHVAVMPVAVFPVSIDGVPEMTEVLSDLVQSSGLKGDLCQTVSCGGITVYGNGQFCLGQASVMCDRFL